MWLIVKTIAELRQAILEAREANPKRRHGFVPTMGALHEGHLSLIRRSKKECDFTSVSIFINPIQFNNKNDLNSYPIETESDLKKCKMLGVDIVFLPDKSEIFPNGKPGLNLSIKELTGNLCGLDRPGYFEGVLLIVARLFNLFQPHSAYFGKKDYQQLILIKRMVGELDFCIDIIGCQTVRMDNGLALSSRNTLLNEKEREQAALIYRALKIGWQTYKERECTPEEVIEIVSDVIESGSLNRVEYVEIVDRENLQKVLDFRNKNDFILATAVFCGSVRLIDNIEINAAKEIYD